MAGKKGRPPSIFGLKSYPPQTYGLTDLAQRIIAQAARRAGTSKSNIVELLARRYGGSVRAEDFQC